MDRDLNLIEYLPYILHEIKEYKEIAKVENPELITLWQSVENVLNDQFIQSSTENGVKRWESILKVLPKGTDNLDERKFRILTRLNEQLPYSLKMLHQQLTTLCGEDGYSVELKNKEFTLSVKVALTAKSNFGDVDSLLHRIVPANMIIDLSLKYNQYSTLANFTYAQLANYTYDQLRNEVIT